MGKKLFVCDLGEKLYIGNLDREVTDRYLLNMFEAHGTVKVAQVILDEDTGRSRGFGFVEMRKTQEAKAAIAALNGQEARGYTP